MVTATSTTRILYLPPLGKPDPKVPRPDSGPDTRPRVLQRGSDYWCTYRAFNDLRERYKAPNTEHLPARKFEKLASSCRKEYAAVYRMFPNAVGYEIPGPDRTFLISINKLQFRSNPTIPPLLTNQFHVPSAALSEFLDQDKFSNLYEFLLFQMRKMECEVHERFLKSIDLDPKVLFGQLKKEDPELCEVGYSRKGYGELIPKEKAQLLD